MPTMSMRYLDARFNYELSNQHFLTFGTDSRRERMRSKSNALINNPDYMSDSFDYNVLGFYIQDSWTPNDKFDMRNWHCDLIRSKQTLLIVMRLVKRLIER